MPDATFFEEELLWFHTIKEYRDPELPHLIARTVFPDETFIELDWPNVHPGDSNAYNGLVVATDRRFILFVCQGGGLFSRSTWRFGRTIDWYQVTEVRPWAKHSMMLEIHTTAGGKPLLMSVPAADRDRFTNFLAEMVARYGR